MSIRHYSLPTIIGRGWVSHTIPHTILSFSSAPIFQYVLIVKGQNHITQDDTPILEAVHGGPIYWTDEYVSQGGVLARNALWKHPLRTFTVDIAYPTVYARERAIQEFIACRGMGRAFRFHDPYDWSAGGGLDSKNAFYAADPHVFAVGDGTTTTYQLAKCYTSATGTYIRPIRRPVAPILIYLDGVEYHWDMDVNYETGMLRFGTPPPLGAQIGWAGMFDIWCRFGTDAMELETDEHGVSRWRNVAIQELYDL